MKSIGKKYKELKPIRNTEEIIIMNIIKLNLIPV
jgi:hypothetical protein